MTINEIKLAIYAWVDGELGITTIFAYPNAPRPIVNYALVNLFNITQIGTKEIKEDVQPDGSTDRTYSTFQESLTSINIFYDNAYQLANTLRNSLEKVLVKDQLWAAGLGFISASTVQFIPEVVEKRWEQRGQFDVTFAFRTEVTETLETIQNIEVTNEIDDIDYTVIIEKE